MRWRDPPRRPAGRAMSAGSATTSSTSCCSSCPKPCFAALVEVALARPVLPAGLVLRFEPAPGVDGWTVVACAPRRRLGTLTRDRDPSGRVVYRAWTRAGDPVQLSRDLELAASWGCGRGAGLGHPGQRGPLSGPGRLCPRPARLGAAPAAGRAASGAVRPAAGGRLPARGDGRMTAVKRCPRCGQLKPADGVLPASPRPAAVVLLPALHPRRRPPGPEPPPAGPGRGRGAAGGGPGPPAPPAGPGRPRR